MITSITDTLLAKYLAGETTEPEANEVKQWIKRDEKNKTYYNQYKLIWDESMNLKNSNVNEIDSWARFKLYRKSREETPAPAKRIRLFQWTAWHRVAAAILIIVFTSAGVFLIYNKSINSGNQQVVFVSDQQVLTDTLPDGTITVLNKESSLRYPQQFQGDSRTVTLEGEAFFEVTPDKKKPFLIYTNNETIKVVGTSFNVKREKDKLEVIVKTGVVEVSNKQYNLKLFPGEMAIFSASGKPIKQKVTDELYNYYRTNQFVCNKTSLKRLVEILNEAFKANIIIAKSELNDEKLTATFNNESLDNILLIVGKTFNIHIEKRAAQILLF